MSVLNKVGGGGDGASEPSVLWELDVGLAGDDFDYKASGIGVPDPTSGLNVIAGSTLADFDPVFRTGGTGIRINKINDNSTYIALQLLVPLTDVVPLYTCPWMMVEAALTYTVLRVSANNYTQFSAGSRTNAYEDFKLQVGEVGGQRHFQPHFRVGGGAYVYPASVDVGAIYTNQCLYRCVFSPGRVGGSATRVGFNDNLDTGAQTYFPRGGIDDSGIDITFVIAAFTVGGVGPYSDVTINAARILAPLRTE